jgi:hypothetical protein
LPGIAYATTTGIYTRSGNAAPAELVALPAGTALSPQLTWSGDGRWLGWFSGPVTGTGQVHVTDTQTRVTHSWPCTSCTMAGAFAGGRFFAGGLGGLTSYPQGGGPPSKVSVPGLPPLWDKFEVLAGTAHDASVLFWAGGPSGGGLYETTPSGAARLVSQLPVAGAPFGGGLVAGLGSIAISPDRTVVAYACNYDGSDPGEPSDSVTIVNLATGKATTTGLPKNPVHPLRISAIWMDSAGTAYATAWPQPASAQGSVPKATVTPHQYRLGNGQWTDTGARNTVAAEGGHGWTVTLEQPPTISDYGPLVAPGRLVATRGARHVAIADNVATFSWIPSGP